MVGVLDLAISLRLMGQVWLHPIQSHGSTQVKVVEEEDHQPEAISRGEARGLDRPGILRWTSPADGWAAY
jgi:hypothetical protein